MSELKTLKDMRHPINIKKELIDPNKAISMKELKTEAIKWIKEISKGGFNKIPEVKFENGNLDCSEVSKAILIQETDIVVRWIKHFFNITEEDIE